MFKCTSKYMLGLSATPDRKDGLGPLGAAPVISWFLGPVITDLRGQGMPTDVQVHVLPYHSPAYDLPPPLARGGACINMAKLVSDMAADEQRNVLIMRHLAELVGQGRRILCLSDRRAHCQRLLELFAAACPGKQGHLYLGGMKPAQLEEAARTGDALFASYGLASEGLDIPTLDSLVLCTPRSDVEQAVGRVLRGAPGPLVLDVLDKTAVGYAQFNKRRAYYQRCGFRVVGGGCRGAPSEIEEEGCAFVSDGEDN